MAILDDVCRSVHGVAEGADQALSQRLTGCSGNKHFDTRGKAFLVRHYAGDVRNSYFFFWCFNTPILTVLFLRCRLPTKSLVWLKRTRTCS